MRASYPLHEVAFLKRNRQGKYVFLCAFLTAALMKAEFPVLGRVREFLFLFLYPKNNDSELIKVEYS